MDVPTWSQLLAALAEVPYARATGSLRWREPAVDDLDRVEDEGAAEFWFAAPDRWRVEDAQGVVFLQDERWTYQRDLEGRLQRQPHRPGQWYPDPLHGLGSGPEHADAFRHGNDDFNAPTGPATRTTVAGRAAWSVVLAPPPHKPYPLALALDEETGTLLREEAAEGRYVREMTRFEPGATVDEGRFTWTGAYDTTQHDERTAWERARTWAQHPRVPVPRWWPTGPRYEAMGGDPDSGAYALVLQLDGDPVLARWPVGGTPPGLWQMHSPHRHPHRWADDTWEWGLAVEVPLSDADLQRVRDSFT